MSPAIGNGQLMHVAYYAQSVPRNPSYVLLFMNHSISPWGEENNTITPSRQHHKNGRGGVHARCVSGTVPPPGSQLLPFTIVLPQQLSSLSTCKAALLRPGPLVRKEPEFEGTTREDLRHSVKEWLVG